MSASTRPPTPLVKASDSAETNVDWLSMFVLVAPSVAPALVMAAMAEVDVAGDSHELAACRGAGRLKREKVRAELPLAPDGYPVRIAARPDQLRRVVSRPIVPTDVAPVLSRENEATMLTECAVPSSRLTLLKDADVAMLLRLACSAATSDWICERLVPGVCAVTRSCFILFISVSVLFSAAVATPTVEEPEVERVGDGRQRACVRPHRRRDRPVGGIVRSRCNPQTCRDLALGLLKRLLGRRRTLQSRHRGHVGEQACHRRRISRWLLTLLDIPGRSRSHEQWPDATGITRARTRRESQVNLYWTLKRGSVDTDCYP